MTDRTAPADTPLLPAIAQRWSPRAFRDEEVPEEALARVLEAGRWAASCYNEQPWAFILARRHREAEAFARILSLLSENNRKWAGAAPVLMVACARMRFSGNGNPNHHAWYDLGQAASAMAIEASGLGLQMHQMAGIDRARAKQELGVPEEVEVAVAIALGRPGDAASLPEALAAREVAPRSRRPRAEWTFTARWGG